MELELEENVDAKSPVHTGDYSRPQRRREIWAMQCGYTYAQLC